MPRPFRGARVGCRLPRPDPDRRLAVVRRSGGLCQAYRGVFQPDAVGALYQDDAPRLDQVPGQVQGVVPVAGADHLQARIVLLRSLGHRLSVGAHHRLRHLGQHRAGERGERVQYVIDDHGRNADGPAGKDRHGPGLHCVRREGVTVGMLTGQRSEQTTALDRARVDETGPAISITGDGSAA